MLSLVMLCAIGQTVDVTIAPGLDPESKNVVSLLTFKFPHINPQAQRLDEIQTEVKQIGNVKILDPLEVNGISVRLPAVRFGRQKWITIPQACFHSNYGALLWLRKELDPWWIDAETQRRQEEYAEAVEAYNTMCNNVREQFYATHGRDYPHIGELGTRLIRDALTGLDCYIVPCMPKAPSRPELVKEFDAVNWYDRSLFGPVEAKKP